MQVRLVLGRRVDVNDELHIADVDSAGGDIRGHEHADISGRKGRQVAVTLRLREVAVQVNAGDPGVDQLAGKLLRVVLRAHEQDAAAGAGGERLNEVPLRVDAVDLEHVVRHRFDVTRDVIHRVQDFVMQVAVHDLVDAVVQCGGEQHPLAAIRGLVQDARDRRQESEVGHVVRLIQHRDLDGIEREEFLLQEVLEAARAGDDDVDTGLKRCNLPLLGDATENGGDIHAIGLSERGQCCSDLGGEFARRRENQPARAPGLAASAVGKPGNHGDREGERLAAAGFASAENVSSAQGVGEGVLLNGKWTRDAGPVKGGNERCGHAERAEGCFSHGLFLY